MQVEITIDQDDWTPELERYLKRWDDLTPVQRHASKVVHDSIDRAYATDGASTGETWPPRKTSYPWPPLIKSAKMKSLQLAASAGQVSKVGDETIFDYSGIVEVTSYSGYHQSGTKNMPKRQTLNLTEQELDDLTQIVADYTLILDWTIFSMASLITSAWQAFGLQQHTKMRFSPDSTRLINAMSAWYTGVFLWYWSRSHSRYLRIASSREYPSSRRYRLPNTVPRMTEIPVSPWYLLPTITVPIIFCIYHFTKTRQHFSWQNFTRAHTTRSLRMPPPCATFRHSRWSRTPCYEKIHST